MTLIEVMIFMMLVLIISAVLIQSVATSKRVTYMTSLRGSAFGMCHARLEEIRAMDYVSILDATFPLETHMRFAHLGGKDRIPLSCARSVTVTEQANPTRKEVQVTVAWDFLGRSVQEDVWAIIYPR